MGSDVGFYSCKFMAVSMVAGSAERSNSVSEERLHAALLLHSVSDGPPASSQQEPSVLPVQQVGTPLFSV